MVFLKSRYFINALFWQLDWPIEIHRCSYYCTCLAFVFYACYYNARWPHLIGYENTNLYQKFFVLHKEHYILSYQFDNNTSFSIHSSQRLSIDIASEWTKLSESALNSSRNFSRAANKKTKLIIISFKSIILHLYI